MTHYTSEKGFTLVELAISITVIGLILGSLLAIQEIVKNTRITSTIAQLKNFDTAAMSFIEIFGVPPGDLKDPSRLLPHCTTSPCSSSGNGNKQIEWRHSGNTTTVEPFNFFIHLQRAKLIDADLAGGTVTNNIFPPSASVNYRPYNPRISLRNIFSLSVIYASPTFGQAAPFQGENAVHYYTLFSPSLSDAAGIDKKADDGNGFTGDVIAYPLASGSTCYLSATGIYDESRNEGSCPLWFRAGF